jgi:2-oxoisovalerate dehydrogenase E1 component
MTTKTLTDNRLIALYDGMLLPRMIEEKMLILLRQGKISKWFSGIGQEAIAVGCTQAMEMDEYILPMHRNLGVFTSRKIPLDKLFAQWQGKEMGFTKGRDRSFHFGTKEHHIIGMISHLGPQLAIADGIALSHKLDGEAKCSLVFSGEGGTSEGDFHEALNVASVWDLPVIFVVENNGYGLSTPTTDQFRCEQIADKAKGYGMEGITINGNNIIEVFETISRLAEDIRRNPRPVLVECMTFRMRGHEEASGSKYVPQDLIDHWATKDPLNNYEKLLLDEGILTQEKIEDLRLAHKKEIDDALKIAFEAEEPEVGESIQVNDLFQEFNPEIIEPSGPKEEIRLIDAIQKGLYEAMEQHPNLILMGQDIAEYGGVFKITDGFVEAFGKERVRNTPICESAIVGAGLGLAINGYKAMIEMQFADFVTCGFNQIINNLAKTHYRWGQNVDVVVRMPTGAGVGAGPFHSQSNEAWFFHTPGLKVVYPATPQDAKGLLLASINDPNPVIFFEHKGLYRSIREEVTTAPFTIEIGKGKMVKEGNSVLIITYGLGVHWSETWAENNPDSDVAILDLRTLLPWDKELVKEQVEKIGKCLILHEDTHTGGIGGEIASWIGEECFINLDAPVMRCSSMDTPIPMNIALEKQFLANNKLDEVMKKLISF